MESMTGYGSVSMTRSSVSVFCEVRSYNHRFTDVSVSISPQDPGITADIESAVRKTVSRGRVYVQIRFAVHKSVEDVVPLKRLKEIHNSLEKYSRSIGCKNEMKIADLIGISLTLSRNEDTLPTDAAKVCLAAFSSALKKMKSMRALEGKRHRTALLSLATELDRCYSGIKERLPFAQDQIRQRVAEVLSSVTPNMETGAANSLRGQIAAQILERIDVEEEVIRLASHILEIKKLVKGGGEVGRKMEFICQELNREFNTLSQKSRDPLLCDHALNGKLLVDKIKEQSENIQ